MDIYSKIKNFPNSKLEASIINDEQINYLITYLLDVVDRKIDGDVVELGCYVGESSKYLRKTLDETKSTKELFVYDSFEGLPPLSLYEVNTGWRPGTLKTTEEVLFNNFIHNNLTPPIITKGWFKNIPEERLPNEISFAFLDGDFYDSIFDSLTKIYDKVTDGGYIIFHDYERNDLPGVKGAIDTFFANRGESFNIIKPCDQLGIIEKHGNVKTLKLPDEINNVVVVNTIEKNDSIELTGLDYYFDKYGTDKKMSGYSEIYEPIFEKIRDSSKSILEIGIGTLDPEINDSFFGILQTYPNYKPGGSLRAWRDYFPNAQIYGIDIAEDCKFEEDRITTFIFNSLDKTKCDEHLKDLKFEVILDDGIHSAVGQVTTMKNLFDRVKDGGYYIIEDCVSGRGDDGVIKFFKDDFNKIANEHEYYLGGKVIIIRKNNSKKGCFWDFESFIKENEKEIIELTSKLGDVKEYVDTLSIEQKSTLLKYLSIKPSMKITNNKLTVVTGLWDIGRPGRDFNHYIENFKNFLEIPINMFIYIPKQYEHLVWEKRSKENTCVKIYELDDIKNLYSPFWDKTQEIRTDPKWVNSTGEGGWLKNSPQALSEWYNPIVQSKMFLLNDVTIWNPFNNEYFIWLDAGITNTVYKNFLTENRALDNIIPHLKNFLFLSYPYEAGDEIHGFNFKAMNNYASQKVSYVCRGGLFGGSKESINQANGTYYSTLSTTISNGYMGTEESIFSIMAHREPNTYRRYSLDGNGLIVKFIDELIKDTVTLEPIVENMVSRPVTNYEISKVKTNLYILTFNFPAQVLHTINSMEKTPEWLTKPHLVLLDNSTDMNVKRENQNIADKYNFEYIDLGGNTGICGGRQAAAEHFDKSDADYMFFFEDDMTSNPPELEGQFCRNGFRKYVPNLYDLVHKIMLKENFDFLKLTFTEVFFDNDKQCSWYNVPQHIRTRDWPDYDKLPISGLDPNVPLTNFKNIRVTDGLSYIDGEIYYANWPMIVSKEGNRKMFIDTKWGHPFEQTWMSHMYQLTKEGKLRPAVLLAAPIWHDRIKYYKADERREN